MGRHATEHRVARDRRVRSITRHGPRRRAAPPSRYRVSRHALGRRVSPVGPPDYQIAPYAHHLALPRQPHERVEPMPEPSIVIAADLWQASTR